MTTAAKAIDKRRIKRIPEDRHCCVCKSTLSYISIWGYEQWHLSNNKQHLWYCTTCFSHLMYEENREQVKANNRKYAIQHPEWYRNYQQKYWSRRSNKKTPYKKRSKT